MIAAEASSRGGAHHVLGGHTHAGLRRRGLTGQRGDRVGQRRRSVWRWDAATGAGTELVTEGPSAHRAAFAADGTLAVGFSDGMVRLWDKGGVRRAELSAGSERVRALVWSHDGHTLVAGGDGGRARVWTVGAAPEPIGAPRELDAGGEIFDLAVSPDDSTIALGGRGKAVRLWTRTTGATRELAAGDGAMRLAWSPDGALLAAGGRDGKTRVWAVATGEETATLEDGGVVRGVVWSADGARLVTGGTAAAIHVWTLATGERADLVGHVEPVSELAIARDGSLVSASHDHTVRVWDLVSGSSRVLSGHRDQVTRLALAGNGAFIVSAGKDHAVRVWPQLRERADVLRVPDAVASDIAWSPDSSALASTWDDAITRVWAPGHPAPPRELAGDAPARAVAFDPTGRSLAWVGGGHDVFIADVAGGEPRRLPGTRPRRSRSPWTPDGHLVTGGLDKSVLAWDSAGASRGIHAHGGGVWSVAISPDGKRAATAGFDGTLALTPLDGSAPAQVRTAHRDGINAVAWSPDGTRVATGSVDESIHIWQANDDTTSRKLDAHRTVTALAWGPDSAHLASAAHDGVIRWWDVGAGTDRVVARHHGAAVAVAVVARRSPDRERRPRWRRLARRSDADTARVFATPGPITRVKFSPDGKRLASAGAAVAVWDVGAGPPPLAATTAQLSEAGELWTPR